MALAALAAGAALAALPSAASAKTVEKKVGATILFQDAINPQDGNNCGTQVVIEWKDPTENNFVGSSWEAHYFKSTRGVAKEYVERPAPPFDNRMTFLGVDFIATSGNNWWKLGGGHRDGGTDAAAQEACVAYSQTLRGLYGSQAWVIVTGEEDRSDSAKCTKAEKALDRARQKVKTARQQLAAAKTDAARARAQQRLTNAIKARARAAAAVGKACNP
ncbi:MAG: hypothetical protein R3C15_05450 [Thermoleophilia bacterium]